HRVLRPRQPDNPRPIRKQQRHRILPVAARHDPQVPYLFGCLRKKLRALPLRGTSDQYQRPRPRKRPMHRLSRGNGRLPPLPRTIQNPALSRRLKHLHLPLIGQESKPGTGKRRRIELCLISRGRNRIHLPGNRREEIATFLHAQRNTTPPPKIKGRKNWHFPPKRLFSKWL